MKGTIFISYRREGGEFLGRILYEKLIERKYYVFYDVESINQGRFDNQIFDEIDKCENFIIILS